MQLHNALLRGNWGDALKMALGMSKGDAVIERAGETLTPIVNLWGMPEWALYRGEILWAIRLQAVAVAGELSACAITLPLITAANSSKWVCVVDGVSSANSTAGGSTFLGEALRANLAATLAAAAGVVNRDFRTVTDVVTGTGIATPALETWTGSDPATLNTPWEQQNFPTATFLPFGSVPYVLKAGIGLWVQGAAVNQIVTANFWGRIRRAFPNELV